MFQAVTIKQPETISPTEQRKRAEHCRDEATVPVCGLSDGSMRTG